MTQQQAQHTSKKHAHGISFPGIGGELVGSFLIFLAIYLVSALSPALYGPSALLVAAATGLAYASMTFIFGKFSGGQFNPAVSLAAMLVGKTGFLNGICYIIAQVLGGIAAGAVVKLVLPTSKAAPAKMWFTNAVNGYDQGSISSTQLHQAGVSFGVLFAVIVEVAASIVIVAAAVRSMDDNGKATSRSAAIIGAAYALGVAFTYPITGAALNPARSTGIAIFASKVGLAVDPLKQLWIFWICPILAAAIVSIVIIIAQMISTKQPGPVKTADVDTDEEAANKHSKFQMPYLEDSAEATTVEKSDDAADSDETVESFDIKNGETADSGTSDDETVESFDIKHDETGSDEDSENK
ncbi:aquaporin [Bifidobacterium sp. ESL0775]|uniref:MIP/aquaporin family protein n=1 Tax=Bifidobacterium sp. ESL0775 TaxID=2983230 RepID=UPI0023F7F254|nr:aquaporin [Bifidobacterium sp. ESL0775]WEV68559.1 aquaporin [Bifidobacterium sp. ESL0775]